ncbi:MAG: lysophospholipid acyltransferase family protein [Pseudomonadota bacterium]
MPIEFMKREFLAPRYWPIWCLFGLQRVVVLLPWSVQRMFGRAVGTLARHIASRRREIAASNLALAYPRLSREEREYLLRAHFTELGIGLLQIGMAWWASDRRISRLLDISGLEHLPAADAPAPTFLVSGHFTTIDMVGRGINLYGRMDALHRPLGNPLVDAIMRVGRRRCADVLIDKHNPKALLARLKDKHTLWVAVDQADTTQSSVEAPFFGVPAATNTTVSRLAGRYDASVLPVSCIRQPNGRFLLQVEPPVTGLGGDPVADAEQLNRIVERHVAKAPAQYYWIHRRFKSRAAVT